MSTDLQPDPQVIPSDEDDENISVGDIEPDQHMNDAAVENDSNLEFPEEDDQVPELSQSFRGVSRDSKIKDIKPADSMFSEISDRKSGLGFMVCCCVYVQLLMEIYVQV